MRACVCSFSNLKTTDEHTQELVQDAASHTVHVLTSVLDNFACSCSTSACVNFRLLSISPRHFCKSNSTSCGGDSEDFTRQIQCELCQQGVRTSCSDLSFRKLAHNSLLCFNSCSAAVRSSVMSCCR